LQFETWISELQRAFNVVVGAPVQRTPSPDQSSLDRRGGMAPPVHPFVMISALRSGMRLNRVGT